MIFQVFLIVYKVLIWNLYKIKEEIIIRIRVVIDFRKFCGCLIGLKNFVLSTFAKNVPLIIKTSGGLLFGGGALFYLGEGITRTGHTYNHTCNWGNPFCQLGRETTSKVTSKLHKSHEPSTGSPIWRNDMSFLAKVLLGCFLA